jgi:hypothetical protein
MKKFLAVATFLAGAALLQGQQTGLDPAVIIKPLSDQWTSYSGDLSGKRYSLLKQVTTATVKNLSLKWVNTLTTGCGPTGAPPARAGGGFAGFGGGGRGGGGAAPAPIIVGGLGNGDANNCGPRSPGGGVLFVDGGGVPGATPADHGSAADIKAKADALGAAQLALANASAAAFGRIQASSKFLL